MSPSYRHQGEGSLIDYGNEEADILCQYHNFPVPNAPNERGKVLLAIDISLTLFNPLL